MRNGSGYFRDDVSLAQLIIMIKGCETNLGDATDNLIYLIGQIEKDRY